jgi:hypothetical protein
MRTIFSIGFRNGDFRGTHFERKSLINDLRYMRDKWPGIEVRVNQTKIGANALDYTVKTKYFIL